MRKILVTMVLAVGAFVAVPSSAALAAPPSFVGVETAFSTTNVTSLSVAVPSGSSGDLLIAVLGVAVNPSTATPAGWTPIQAGFNQGTCASGDSIGIRCQLNTWYKVASSASEGPVSFSWGGTLRQAAGRDRALFGRRSDRSDLRYRDTARRQHHDHGPVGRRGC